MTRAVIYARFSSDLQSDRSIEDQERLCREICGRAGYDVLAVYQDRALSGTSTNQRAGFQAMMQVAALRGFDVIVAEDIDRLFRNERDFHDTRQRLTFLSISIHTAQGVVSRIEGSLRAMMSAMFIENLALHVRRGMTGRVRQGHSAGGNHYGYRSVKGSPGELVIDDAEAAVVRRIFESFVGGTVPRKIAAELNADNIRPPIGAFWRANTINGDGARQCGILRNEIYVGKIVWNKTHKVRNPDSGRRLNRPNPESEWQRADAPHLRIIPDDLFAAAGDIRAERARTPAPQKRTPLRMLSGLIKCGACGGGMSIKDYDGGRPRINCTNAKESGSCEHSRAYSLQPIEREVIGGLRSHLGNRAAIARFIRTYNEERERTAGDAIRLHAQRVSRATSIEREIERTVAAVARGIITDAEAGRHLPALRTELAEISGLIQTAGQPVKVVAMHPTAVDAYLRDLERLNEAISRDIAAGNAEVAQAIRRLVERVIVHPSPAGEFPALTVVGHLSTLLGTHRDSPGGYSVPGSRHHSTAFTAAAKPRMGPSRIFGRYSRAATPEPTLLAKSVKAMTCLPPAWW